MALILNPCLALILSACVALTVRADCGKVCELCLFHLQGRQTDLSTFSCIQECEGSLTTRKNLDLCKDVLQGNGADALTDEDRAIIDGTSLDEQPEEELAKRYGGFMKRYGGFMKKSGEAGAEAADESQEIMGKRYGGFMKKDGEGSLNALKKLLAAAVGDDGSDGPAVKRYGGFMRAVTRSSDLEEGVKALQKRYGGFMRRVGSPNWDEHQKRYGGFLKRSWGSGGETGSPVTEKRYGGFMD
ncbi:hypothetical protein AGOR_G00034170 [Albula goreensis]|uniref:Synenkephalin n=1 Tax=Albula goreensis TaxID=1534307 RepID=A0A8T3DWU3_9TELE|nr:hypothetical protein AGOR_G00034170 [Albula goreensis]